MPEICLYINSDWQFLLVHAVNLSWILTEFNPQGSKALKKHRKKRKLPRTTRRFKKKHPFVWKQILIFPLLNNSYPYSQSFHQLVRLTFPLSAEYTKLFSSRQSCQWRLLFSFHGCSDCYAGTAIRYLSPKVRLNGFLSKQDISRLCCCFSSDNYNIIWLWRRWSTVAGI